ncbi:unnamed protein product [Spirodela intermedia]|uniref:Chitinase domain-containing protein 1 n=1 Tax=Spirodela intermedia TaxID=51605 RepID=A0A7I8ITB3_SPIIN|nr:unnamed protein product [Spirodela intermedia]CAA6661046.1 unnamed protein product [Spirodela intermedia]
MATRKRGRRISGAAEISRRNDPAGRMPRPGSGSTSSGRLRIFSLLALILLALLLLYFKAYGGRKYGTVSEDGSILSVYDRGLVKREITYREVLAENSRTSENTSVRHFLNPVLAYVTPWNSLGYELAEKFCFKLTHVSPVWYDLKSERNNFFLEGRHNSDSQWISRIKTNRNLVVLPRFVLEVLPSEMLKRKKQRDKVIDIIVSECKEMGYDGVVLESWSRWAMHGVLHDVDMRRRALEFVKELATTLHSVNSSASPRGHLELVFVIPPPRSQHLKEHDFGRDDLRRLLDIVDGFSLMTYDFSGPHSPGPNAPLLWIRSTLELLLGDDGGARENAYKIFVGINFYGNDFLLTEGPGGEAITGRDYLSLLRKHRPALQWEAESSEHFFLYSHDKVRPRSRGAALSIWEIGQGLDYFFDLL